ncbi:MAG: CvpA family protein [Anaerolineales bacterium]|nr:CvpA family protein [Anaerolineales bacterium]MCZ2122989.1 CvpA family protein [Anaerolineales bacterium]
MMSILYLFWMYVLLFAVIGAMRGWAKELLVIFSSITALAVNLLMDKYIPLVRDLPDNSSSVFWTRALILLALVYFGYQTINLAPRLASKAARERLQDALFGAVVGGLNGYFIAGSLLFYNHVADYPYRNVISPATDPTLIAAIDRMMQYMPPRLLGEPGIYFAVIIILVFIIVVYI